MSAYLIVALGVAAFLGFALLKKRKATRPTKASTPWVISQGRNVPPAPTMQGNGWHIDLPPAPGYVAYVSWIDQPLLREGQALTIRYRVEGGPIIATEYPDSPADAGLMVQRRGDNLTARGKYAGYRWFCHQHFPLTEGEHEFTIPLTVEHWGPVMSDPQAASFSDCLREADSLNVVFGGAGGRGHGVFGSGRFTLLRLA